MPTLILRNPFKPTVNFGWSIILVFIATFSTGCYSYKDQILFQGLKDTVRTITETQEKSLIQAGDQLSIMVFGLDEKTTAYFNTPMGIGPNGQTQMLAQSSQQGGGIFGYVVGEDGNIAFPKLGLLNVAGYDQERLRDSLQSWLLPWVKDPAVIVRLMNFRVTYITSDRAQTINLLNNQNDIFRNGQWHHMDRPQRQCVGDSPREWFEASISLRPYFPRRVFKSRLLPQAQRCDLRRAQQTEIH